DTKEEKKEINPFGSLILKPWITTSSGPQQSWKERQHACLLLASRHNSSTWIQSDYNHMQQS
ncbi:hypothetical protein ATANTOWER_017996, partial [Ataeniobius toweri]|nr:hypothetical protein [Ataeniobius toweri]